ncbi:MAG: amidohydrolase family protein [Acidobacteriaceae bacterium]|nr:amidohydrolase family protein [Acidobacteriaceae bacterium]MBV9223090.1 amidohydrolase family protein [Acidobacteriaceae bacterium]
MYKLDAHQHFWKFEPSEYGWIDKSMGTLRRDFLPPDLKPVIDSVGVNGTVAVQARQTSEETRWLLSLAEQYPFIRGVVGWVPLLRANVGEILADLSVNIRLRGVRHVLHDEADPFYMLQEDFQRGIRELKRYGLAYDVLIFERHLPQTIRFVDHHPDQVFIVDHLAKPRVKAHQLSPWRENMRELACRSNVYCKVSGLITEADHQRWKPEDLEPYLQTVLAAFGPKRLLFGSDWPVCLLAGQYQQWVSIVEQTVSKLSVTEQEWVWSCTAQLAYRLS